MTTGATGQLGLALPVQGELSGTWGDTVNNGITQYTNLAIGATLTLTNDGAVTLANTTGDATASNITSTLTGAGTVTAQHAIVRVTGTLTTTKVITGPSYSKTYVVINDATGGSVTIKASGQTGVTIAVGDKALVAYNGTDYVRVGASAGGSNTQVQYNSSGNLAGSANMTFDGTTLTAAGFSGPHNGTVGATTPSTGSFTTLAASSTVSGTGFSNYLASPPAIGGTAPAAGTFTSVTLNATSGNITGDFSNATVLSRNSFKTSTTNGSTGIYALPNGTSTAASWQATNAADPTNASKVLIATNASTDVQLVSGINGTGTYLPLAFYNGGLGRFVIGTSGQFGIGPTASVSYGTTGQVLTSQGAAAAPVWSTPASGSTSIGLVRAIAVNCILC